MSTRIEIEMEQYGLAEIKLKEKQLKFNQAEWEQQMAQREAEMAWHRVKVARRESAGEK